jgi:hypothetical protein
MEIEILLLGKRVRIILIMILKKERLPQNINRIIGILKLKKYC